MSNPEDNDGVFIKRPVGRPKGSNHKPTPLTRRQVKMFCGMGFTSHQMAAFLCISANTLRKYYRKELDSGVIELNFNVANNLYNMATDPDHKSAATSAIFWLKAKAGWKESSRTELTGPDGGPINSELSIKASIDPRLLTAEQRQSLREIIAVSNSQPEETKLLGSDNDLEHGEEYDDEPDADAEDDTNKDFV